MTAALSVRAIGPRRQAPAVLLAIFGLFVLACGSSSGHADAPDATLSTAVGGVSTTSSVHASLEGPSAAARMICSTEAREAVASSLALSSMPATTPAWHEGLFTCTYSLPTGVLVLSVKELADVPAAHQYFASLEARIGPAEQITGLANLGLLGFQSPTGNVIFLKDAMTLQVDAAALGEQLGPNRLSKSEFAYQIATVILACWKGH